MGRLKNFHNKTASLIIVILLVSTFVTSVPYSVLASSDTSASNSTSQTEFHAVNLPPSNNAVTPNTDHHVILFPTKQIIPHATAKAFAKNLNQPSASVGKVSGNDGYCFELSCGPLTYHNGKVMHNAKILIVFWVGGRFTDCSTSHYFEDSTNDPSASTPNDCSYMNLQVQFFKDFCSDPFMKIASQYTDGSGGAGSCFIASPPAGRFNPLVDTSAFPHATLTEADIQAESKKMATYMGATFDGNTQVYVFTPYSTPSCTDSSATSCFGVSYCAYHGWTSSTFLYASIPDADAANGNCGIVSTSPNSDPVSDLVTSPLSHELIESLTDPSGNGWYFANGVEIGDECAYDFGITNSDGSNILLGKHGNPYLIQKEWSNSNGGCTLSENSLPTPPDAPPTAIVASPISSSSIGLTWTAPSSATSYNVFRSILASGPFTTLAGISTTTSFTDINLSPTTTYYYKLTASNIGGTSTISSIPSSATTLTVSPPVPTGITITSMNSTAITVSWTASPGATGYNIYRSITAVGPFGIPITSPSASPYIDNTLSPNMKYFYKVSSINSGGESALSTTVSATTPPVTPTAVSATTVSSSSIKLSWTASLGATSYKIFRSTAVAGPFTMVVTSTTSSFTNTRLSDHTTYFYKIGAVNTGSTSPLSTPPVNATTVPLAPSNVAASTVNATAIKISWTASPGSISYNVFRSTVSAGPFTTLAGSNTTNLFTDTGLNSGKHYFYKIGAVNIGGRSLNSSTVSATTPPVTPTAVSATTVSSSSIKLSWTASLGATSYKIFRSTAVAGPFTTSVGAPTTNLFTNTGLTSNTQYYYKISAVNTGGTSQLSTFASATTAPPVPTGVKAAKVNATAIMVSWTASPGAASYDISRATAAAGPFVTVSTLPASPFTDMGLVPSTKYFYHVDASSASGTSLASITVSAITK